MKNYKFWYDCGTVFLEAQLFEKMQEDITEKSARYLLNCDLSMNAGVLTIKGNLRCRKYYVEYDHAHDHNQKEWEIKWINWLKEFDNIIYIPEKLAKRIPVTIRHGFLWMKKKIIQKRVMRSGYYLCRRGTATVMQTSNFCIVQ